MAVRFARLGRTNTAIALSIILLNVVLILQYCDNRTCNLIQNTDLTQDFVEKRAYTEQRQRPQPRQQQQRRQQQPLQMHIPDFSIPEVPTATQCSYNREKTSGMCLFLSSAKDTSAALPEADEANRESWTAIACQNKLLNDLLQKKNCAEMRYQRGYGRWPVTPEERDFPLAFSFKLHTAPEMFERLLSVLWRPHNLYVVHVDLKAPTEVYEKIKAIVECFDNVVVTEERTDVVYASILSLQADIICIKEALKSPIPWRYHLSLSGQEFPLKTNLELVQILRLLNGSNDIENYAPTMSKSFMKVLVYKCSIISGINYITDVERPDFTLPDVEIRKGSAYNTVSRAFLEWVLQDNASQALLSWLNDTWAADELFWATVGYLPNAPGGVGAAIRHDRGTHLSRAVLWEWDQPRCRGPYLRMICLFSSLDLPWLLSRPELIANKFDTDNDSLVLDCLQQELERRAVQGYREVMSAAAERDHYYDNGDAEGDGVAMNGGGRIQEGIDGVGRGEGGRGEGLEEREKRTDYHYQVSSLNWAYYKSLPHLRYRRRD